MLSKVFSNTCRQSKSLLPASTRAFSTKSGDQQPKRVVVTGAAGAISYSVLFRIARYIIIYEY
jgi:hypothetical protein